MPRPWTRRHPTLVAAAGSVLLAVAVAGLVATLVGAVAVPSQSYGPLIVITAAVGVAASVLFAPLLWRLAKAGRLGPARRAGGLGEQGAGPVDT